jgi:hypothetical protein
MKCEFSSFFEGDDERLKFCMKLNTTTQLFIITAVRTSVPTQNVLSVHMIDYFVMALYQLLTSKPVMMVYCELKEEGVEVVFVCFNLVFTWEN